MLTILFNDHLFILCSFCFHLGLPRIYISANSGARIGLAEEVKSLFKVAWCDPKDYAKGFDYLYLNEPDYTRLNQNNHASSVRIEPIMVEGEKRYRILDIIGKANGLGVENLRGSGLIAGETSLAYKDIFTITLVTCRSVGM